MKHAKYKLPTLVMIGVMVLTLVISMSIAVAATTNSLSSSGSNAATNKLSGYVTEVGKMNQELSKQSIDNVITTITFSEALSNATLQEYVEKYDIRIVQLQARGFDADGNRITFFSRTDKGIDETYRMLNELAAGDGIDFVGVIGMYALTDAENIGIIQADRYTFLADTTGDAFFTGNQSTNGIQRNTAKYGDAVSKAFPQSVAWDAEELELVDYSRK